MKKFLKFCIIAAVSMLLIGIVISAAVSIVKGPEYLNEFLVDITDGRMNIWMEKMEELETGGKNLLENVGEGTGNLIGEVMDSYGEFEGYDIEDSTMFNERYSMESGNIDKILDGMDATRLKIELGGCALEILNSQDGSTKVATENVGKFQAYQDGKELCIRATRKAKENAENCKITLYLPEGYVWEEADIEVGAGYIEISQMYAKELELEVGAGKITAAAITAEKLSLSVGAGEIRMTDAQAANLEASVGMGNLNYQGTVSGSMEAECSMGNMTIQLTGKETDYDYEIECVAGSIYLGEKQYSGAVKEQTISNGTGRKADLECSMGNIKVSFTD